MPVELPAVVDAPAAHRPVVGHRVESTATHGQVSHPREARIGVRGGRRARGAPQSRRGGRLVEDAVAAQHEEAAPVARVELDDGAVIGRGEEEARIRGERELAHPLGVPRKRLVFEPLWPPEAREEGVVRVL